MTGASLAELARRVRHLGVAGRPDPESVLVEKDEIAAELLRLSRAAPRPPAPVTGAPGTAAGRPAPAWSTAVRPTRERARRLEALTRAQAAELELPRGVLAAAVRRRPRRERDGGRQLELALP